MAFSYRFSVGTIKVGNNAMGIATDIAVSYDGDPQSFYGGDYRMPMAIELGNQSGEITCSTARFLVDGHAAKTPLDNVYHTVALTAGQNGGGFLAVDITNCKVTTYNVTSTQNDFVTSDMTMIMCDTDASPTGSATSWSAWDATKL